ncbi:MAG: TnpV protein [Oscillospiraceae bacterium]|nr:TnpV protein [Oscillospiraceae bacterium]MBQ6699637.1 TnpV protein [Oscillospiraceae bacterium]
MDYTLCGDYYLPNLLPVQEEEYNIGIYGQRYFRYIKEHDKILFINLLTTGKLNEHVAEVDTRAQTMESMLVKQMTEQEDINEALKEQDQMEWVQHMNNIWNRVEEIIYKNLING